MSQSASGAVVFGGHVLLLGESRGGQGQFGFFNDRVYRRRLLIGVRRESGRRENFQFRFIALERLVLEWRWIEVAAYHVSFAAIGLSGQLWRHNLSLRFADAKRIRIREAASC